MCIGTNFMERSFVALEREEGAKRGKNIFEEIIATKLSKFIGKYD